MPRALKDLLIACCLTLASVALGVLLADSARVEPAGVQPDRPGAGQPSGGASEQPAGTGPLQGRSASGRPRLPTPGTEVREI